MQAMFVMFNMNTKRCYNVYIDPVSKSVLKSASFFIEKTEPERGGLPTVLLNPRDCTLLAGSIRPSLSGFLYEK
jgi:hypothetical protein